MPPRDDGRIRLVYATSRLEDPIGRMLTDPLRQVLDAHSEVELTIWGPRLEALASHPRVRIAAARPRLRQVLRAVRARAFRHRPGAAAGRCVSSLQEQQQVPGVRRLRRGRRLLRHAGLQHLGRRRRDRACWCRTPMPPGCRASSGSSADHALRARIAENGRVHAEAHFHQRVTDREWMAQIAPLAARRADAPIGSPAASSGAAGGARPLATALRALNHAVRLGAKVGPVLRRKASRRPCIAPECTWQASGS